MNAIAESIPLTPAELECARHDGSIDETLAATLEYMQSEAVAGYSVCLTPNEALAILAWIDGAQERERS